MCYLNLKYASAIMNFSNTDTYVFIVEEWHWRAKYYSRTHWFLFAHSAC